jgi:hypothetical protein
MKNRLRRSMGETFGECNSQMVRPGNKKPGTIDPLIQEI